MKLNTPLPQSLPKECQKASKIFNSFVDSGNNGLDGVIPRSVLENAKGFAIFTIFKAGFLFSARAGSGIVIAKLDDGTWSPPSAIGTAGLGVGGQAGAEMTDFLVVLNSRSAVRSFMSAGSLTLGGNMSIALGPLGRNGEATGSINTSGRVAAMYSYSKTRGLFGGVSVEGSVIVERQDANSLAYKSDVTVKQLLSGAVDPPEWASSLIKTLEACTGMPGNRKWVNDNNNDLGTGYAFGSGVASPSNENRSTKSGGKKKSAPSAFPPPAWGRKKETGSYFESETQDESDFPVATRTGANSREVKSPPMAKFDTHFDSDFSPDELTHLSPHLSFSPPAYSAPVNDSYASRAPFKSLDFTQSSSSPKSTAHSRSSSVPYPFSKPPPTNPFATDSSTSHQRGFSLAQPPYIAPKPELTTPLSPHEGIARAIALYDFQAVESGDLSFSKGDVITVTKKSNSNDDWWTGKLNGREGIFPANFVEVV